MRPLITAAADPRLWRLVYGLILVIDLLLMRQLALQ